MDLSSLGLVGQGLASRLPLPQMLLRIRILGAQCSDQSHRKTFVMSGNVGGLGFN